MSEERVRVPLAMLKGNMELLLEETVPVNGISLRWANEGDPDQEIILVLHFGPGERENAHAMGFKTKPLTP